MFELCFVHRVLRRSGSISSYFSALFLTEDACHPGEHLIVYCSYNNLAPVTDIAGLNAVVKIEHDTGVIYPLFVFLTLDIGLFVRPYRFDL